MKLGTETNSLTNHLYSRMTIGAPEPTIGMGATLLRWTDRTACTVTAIEGNIITVTEDEAIRTDDNGMSESQAYDYSPNPNGATYQFRRNRRGQWVNVVRNDATGRMVKAGGPGLLIGERCAYHDYSF